MNFGNGAFVADHSEGSKALGVGNADLNHLKSQEQPGELMNLPPSPSEREDAVVSGDEYMFIADYVLYRGRAQSLIGNRARQSQALDTI